MNKDVQTNSIPDHDPQTSSDSKAIPSQSVGQNSEIANGPSSLRDLIERVSGKGFRPSFDEEDSGIAEVLPFPFLAIVAQSEMKISLVLTLINPMIGGALLIGPRGTGKSTAARSLVDLLPNVPRSLCYYGCMPEDIETGGLDSVCPDCARKYGEGEPLTRLDRVRLVELPLNARIEDVIGGIDDRAAINEKFRIRKGLLAQADRNILYIDEINLLSNEIVDVILDASAQGNYTVRRGPISATYRSRFTLIGSMNPEEGKLRPQIMDRFGLRVVVRGLDQTDDRLEAYRRVQAYLSNPRKTVNLYAHETSILREEIQSARDLLPQVKIPDQIANHGLAIVDHLGIDSFRAELTLFETARAYAAADGRHEVSDEDIRNIAPLALRARRSSFMNEYLNIQQEEEVEIEAAIRNLINSTNERD